MFNIQVIQGEKSHMEKMNVETMETRILDGYTLYIRTAYTCTKVTKRTVQSWKKRNLKLFRDDNDPQSPFHGFFIRSGKHWNFCDYFSNQVVLIKE